jgi:aromatic-L-amino-acid decarboxylase
MVFRLHLTVWQLAKMQNTTIEEILQLGGKSPSELGAEHTLDPSNWHRFRAQAHRMLDDMLDYTQHIRNHRVWQPIPEQARERFRIEVPTQATDLAAVHAEFMQHILPFTSANSHPGFMGWVQGGGTPVGMLAEMLAAGLNANLGGRDQIPLEVERQIAQWMRQIFGFPETATGLFVSGTSMANLIAVVIARDVALGFKVREHGVAADPIRLTAYASAAVHGCIAKAMDICGIGSDALRLVPTGDQHRIDLAALTEAVQKDRAEGFQPFLVVGSAGTVDVGAVDDLARIADVCQREKLWFHVDGAYGALAKLAPDLAHKLAGLERADSLAFDFHKWAQVPYDAGYILVRNGEHQQQSFASSSAYLSREERGLSAGSPWPCDLGPELSRSFRALKTWVSLKVYGTKAIGESISRTCELARYLKSRIADSPELELLAPVELNIVCFRYVGMVGGSPAAHAPADHGTSGCRAPESHTAGSAASEILDQLNRDIVIHLQESGAVAPSTTFVRERLAIRVAIVNHRTVRTDIDTLIEAVLTAGRSRQAALPGATPPSEEKPQPWHEWNTQLRQLNAQLAEMEELQDKLSATEANLHKSLQWMERQESACALDAQLNTMLDRQRKLEASIRVKRAVLLALMGRTSEARDDHLKVVSLDSKNRLNLLAFGQLLMQTGYCQAAQTVHAEAVKHHPGDLVCRVNFGAVLLQRGDAAAAREQYEAALAISPEYPEAHAGLYFSLAKLGESSTAEFHRQKSFAKKNLYTTIYRGAFQPISVLLLVSSRGGNVPIQQLLDDRIFQTCIMVADFQDGKAVLPAHQIVINAVGDYDVASDALDAADLILARTSAPVINAPSAVRATNRCDIARRLSSVPGAVTPNIITMAREALAAPGAQATLAASGFEFPLLLRTPGFHGGEHFLRVDDLAALPDALTQLPGHDLTVIQFLDARSPDGKTRKFRVMMIDGALYPLHVAISNHWKVHYFSAQMTDHPEHRAEDAEFLRNMPGVLGPRAMATLDKIRETLGLDYAGIDFGLNEKSEVLVFEANATMVAPQPEEGERWDYRRPAVEKIHAAVRHMLEARVPATVSQEISKGS